MLNPIKRNFRGLVIISGSTKSGKSQLAEYLIKQQKSITYIATSRPRPNDPAWETRINAHKSRRPKSWTLLEHPDDICKAINSLAINESILLDSLGGLVENHLMKNEDQWKVFECEFLECLLNTNSGIFVVSEEVGWGIVPSTPVGNLFRERHSKLTSMISRHSKKCWLAVNGTAIDLDKIGDLIP